MPKFDTVARELRGLYRKNGNRLHPEDVVNAARDPESVLHSHFTWDDSKAADEYRLFQARRLIATVKIVVPASGGNSVTVRAYHALRSERKGYRHTKDIVTTKELRDSLLSQLVSDLERIKDTYEAMRKMAETRKLFDVIEEFCGNHKERAEAVGA
jgi:hypothetical protein